MQNDGSRPRGIALLSREIAACREAANSGRYALIELDCRIWKNALDDCNGPDLLKDPCPIILPMPQRN
jgi:hypothetical protein